MAYKHDLLVSYMHDQAMEEWVHLHLLPFLHSFVGNALTRKIDIFVDRVGIAAGDSWPLRLRDALAHSRALLAIWNPLYFHSPWCRRECAVMMHREAALGYRTTTRQDGLVIPINVFDGDYFPEKARVIQYLDCRDYWIAGEGFRRTELYVQFQGSLKNWSESAARSIAGAPRWRKAWTTDAWFEVSDHELMPKSTRNFRFTGLE